MLAPAVPELTEDLLHESIDARTESLVHLRELGPPDLVHMLRQVPRSPGKQLGVYHHVTGVDASSSASLAAYINTLTYRDPGAQPPSKIVAGLYCCYNAFSRLDVRVHVTIPGTVEAYCIDERGNRQQATEELWLETYLCSVLRAYSYADDGSGDTIKKIVGVRRFNPITNTDSEDKFLHAAEHLFFRGWHLGSDAVVQVPNIVSNHLTTGLLRYFETTSRYTSGIKLFDSLRKQNLQVSSLLAKVLFMANEEVKGIGVLYHALKGLPMDYVLLDTQAEFLLKKAQIATSPEQRDDRLRMALGCADRSTIAAPSEFGTWARLAHIYVTMEDWENALTILNSCPMFTYQDKDSPIMPEPKDIVLPTLPETRLDEIDSEPENRGGYGGEPLQGVDPSLTGLRAAQYRGTFKAAYAILTEMTARIGWDQLLKIRSNVFVMEDEYRSEKQDAVTQQQQQQQQQHEHEQQQQQQQQPSRPTSIDGLRGTPEVSVNGDAEKAENGEGGEDGEKEEGIKEEKEENGVEEKGEDGVEDKEENGVEDKEEGEKGDNGETREKGAEEEEEQSRVGREKENEKRKTNGEQLNVEKPTHTIDPGEVRADKENGLADQPLSKLNNKRLCERWLDALFMILYEDLRVYTIWRTQVAQYRAQSMHYRKSSEEWEILGALAERLNHTVEAVEAYTACLTQRFSPKALSGILRALERAKGPTRDMINAAIKLVTWQYRWYSEFSPELLSTIRGLIDEEGAVKVRSIIQATNLPQNVLDLTHHYAALCATFRGSPAEN